MRGYRYRENEVGVDVVNYVRKFKVFEGGDLDELNEKSVEFQRRVRKDGGRVVATYLKHIMKVSSEEQFAGELVKSYEYSYAIVIVYDVPDMGDGV